MNVAVIAETVRRHVSSVGFLAFLVLMGLVGLFGSGFAQSGTMWPSLAVMLAIITGSAIVGPEFSTGSLQLVVSKPLRRSTYLLSRVAGVFTSVTLAATVGLAAETAGRLLLGKGVPWARLASMFAGGLATAILAIAILTLLGSLTRSYFNAAIYLGSQIALSATLATLGIVRMRGRAFGEFLQQNPIIERSMATIDDVLFASVPMQLTVPWLVQIAITVTIALALACAAFERREVPYGAD